MPDWLTSSVVLAALVTAFVALQNSERKIKIEHITGERAKWRDKVREKALQVHQAAVAGNAERLLELHLEFSLILNPNDPEDRKILLTISKLSSEDMDTDLLQSLLSEFEQRIAFLLKHDWERAKSEADPFWKRREPPKRDCYPN